MKYVILILVAAVALFLLAAPSQQHAPSQRRAIPQEKVLPVMQVYVRWPERDNRWYCLNP